jgi:mycofactocin precursor peptide peptidase
MELGPTAWPSVSGGLLLVPLGSCEQHGPHLPLDTDTRIAEAVARAAAAALGGGAVVAPAVAYGASGEHQAFAGTLSIGQEALELVLVELGRSATESFSALVFVCGHGGNAPAVRAAVSRLRSEGREASAWFPDVPGGDAHAGRTETSLLLAVAPALVGPERPLGNAAPLAELLPALVRDGVRPHAPDGVLGDARAASAAEGRALLADLARSLATHVTSIASP